MRQVSSMANFIFAASIIITLQVTLCQAGSQAQTDDGGDTDSSDSPGVSRLVTCKPGGKANFVTVPCVPKVLSQFDTICRNRNFVGAVAVGNPERSDSLTRQPCVVGRWWNKYYGNYFYYRYRRCPSGSTCVRIRYGSGVCCYGDPTSSTDTTADDPTCPDQCAQPCVRGERCQKCGDGFACLPETKPGSCPAVYWKWNSGYFCWQANWRTCTCRSDKDCTGNKKCCRDKCRRFRCQEPSDAPPLECPTSTPEPTSSSTTGESSTASTTEESSTASTTEEPSTASTSESSTSSTTTELTDPPL